MRSGQVEKDHVDQDFCAHLVLKSLPIANDLGLGHLRAKERLAYTLVPIGLSLQLAGGGSTGGKPPTCALLRNWRRAVRNRPAPAPRGGVEAINTPAGVSCV